MKASYNIKSSILTKLKKEKDNTKNIKGEYFKQSN
jgi:hypothetical protein